MDIRLVETLEHVLGPQRRRFAVTGLGQRSVTAADAHLERLRSIPIPVPGPAMRAALDELRSLASRCAPDDPATLHAQILEEPFDDGLREVLADLLQQRDDPRGEFITLQLARQRSGAPRTKREATLERTWGRDWLGALAPAFEEDSVVFERGFPAAGRWKGDALAEKTIGIPEWGTVTRIDMTGRQRVALLVARSMRSLREVAGLDERAPRMLATHGPRTWESVGFCIGEEEEVKEALTAAALFPEARRLELVTSHFRVDFRPHKHAALLARWPNLTELELCVEPAAMAEIVAATEVPRIVIRAERMTIALERAARTASIVASSAGRGASLLAAVIEPLAAAGLVETADLRFGVKEKRDADGFVLKEGSVSIDSLRKLATRTGVALTAYGKAL